MMPLKKVYISKHTKLKWFSLLLLFLSLTLDINAQSTFYINPKAGMAMTFTSVKGFKPSNTAFISPYSVGRNYNFLKSPSLTIGLAAGLITKNQRHKIEFEWEKGAVSYQSEIFVSDYRYAESSWEVVNPSIKEKMNRLLINYAYKLTQNPNKTAFWINVSSGISFSSMFNLFMGRIYNNFHLAPNVYLDHISFQPISQTNVNANIRMGFDVDFYRREKYILSLSLCYTQGFGKLQRNELHIGYTKYNEDFSSKEVKDFSREIYSRGSAFQLSISRRLQFYPWKPGKKVKNTNPEL